MKELHTFRKFLSENALGVDKGDGTFEITADIDIMGKKFNFSDICPGAHNAIKDLANEYKNDEGKLGDVLLLANLHQDFFNLEKKALGPQKIDADEVNEVKRLYVEITNIAFNAFGPEVGGDITEYMNMHMDKIKKSGLKASKPGGTSDEDFYNMGLEENDKALDEILNEEKYEYVVTIEKNGKKTETLAYKSKGEADAKAKKINGGSMGKEFKATVSKDK